MDDVLISNPIISTEKPLCSMRIGNKYASVKSNIAQKNTTGRKPTMGE